METRAPYGRVYHSSSETPDLNKNPQDAPLIRDGVIPLYRSVIWAPDGKLMWQCKFDRSPDHAYELMRAEAVKMGTVISLYRHGAKEVTESLPF